MLTGYLFGSSNCTDTLGRFVHSPEQTDSNAEIMMLSMALMRNLLFNSQMMAFPVPYSPASSQTLVLYLCCAVDAAFSAAIDVPLGWGHPANPAVGGTEHVAVNGRKFAFFSSLVVLSLKSDLLYQSLKARQDQNT